MYMCVHKIIILINLCKYYRFFFSLFKDLILHYWERQILIENMNI